MVLQITFAGASSFEGMRAAKLLLQDAKQTFFGPSGRIYEKTGGYEQATKDFDLTKPRNLEQDPDHMVTLFCLFLLDCQRYSRSALMLI